MDSDDEKQQQLKHNNIQAEESAVAETVAVLQIGRIIQCQMY